MTREDAELAETARQLKAAFASCYERKYGRPYRPNKRFDTIEFWTKTAKIVQKANAVPEEYIRAQFIYSLGTVFANTLHGPTAKENWKKFIRANGAVTLGDNRNGNITSSDVAQLYSKIQQVESLLAEQFGPTFKLTKENILDPRVKKEILDSWWRYDAVVIMAYASDDTEYRKKFLLPAAQVLVESPYLIKAAMHIGIDLTHLCRDYEE